MTRQLLGFAVGVLWLVVAGWVFVFAAALAGVSIDAGGTPIVGWWWASVTLALITLVGGRFWPILAISALAGVALILQMGAASAGSTADIVSSLDSIAILVAAPTLLSLIGLAARVHACSTTIGLATSVRL